MGQRLLRTKKGFHGLYKGDLSNDEANHEAEEMFMSEQYDQQEPPLLSQQDSTAIWSGSAGYMSNTFNFWVLVRHLAS